MFQSTHSPWYCIKEDPAPKGLLWQSTTCFPPDLNFVHPFIWYSSYCTNIYYLLTCAAQMDDCFWIAGLVVTEKKSHFLVRYSVKHGQDPPSGRILQHPLDRGWVCTLWPLEEKNSLILLLSPSPKKREDRNKCLNTPAGITIRKNKQKKMGIFSWLKCHQVSSLSPASCCLIQNTHSAPPSGLLNCSPEALNPLQAQTFSWNLGWKWLKAIWKQARATEIEIFSLFIGTLCPLKTWCGLIEGLKFHGTIFL